MKIFKKLILALSAVIFTIPAVACRGDSDPTGFEKGYYVAQSVKIDGISVMNEYLYYVINVKDDSNLEIKTCTIAGVKTEDCTYTFSDDTVNIKIGRREYPYTYDAENKTLSFSGEKGTEQEQSHFKYQEDYTFGSSQSGGVSFTKGQMLWDDDAGVFNYCPTVMVEGDTMHAWFCTDEQFNEDINGFVDTIGYRQGKLQPNGKWVFGSKSIAVKPGRTNGRSNPNEWDYMQCCDPTVVKGSFNYNGEDYSYLMAYLGSKVSNAMNNETGIAVAKNPGGPWVKINEGSETAFISYYNDPNFVDGEWGIGQASLISVDGQGKVLIFFSYTADRGRSAVEYWDLSNLNNPQRLRDRAILSDVGIRNIETDNEYIHNGDFAYDSIKNRIYVISDEYVYAQGNPTNVTDSSRIYYVQLDNNESFLGEMLFNKTNYEWQPVQRLDKAVTGSHKVHNSALITDAYGKNIWHDKLYVMYTGCINAPNNSPQAVGSYRHYSWEISL